MADAYSDLELTAEELLARRQAVLDRYGCRTAAEVRERAESGAIAWTAVLDIDVLDFLLRGPRG